MFLSTDRKPLVEKDQSPVYRYTSSREKGGKGEEEEIGDPALTRQSLKKYYMVGSVIPQLKLA